MKIKTDYEGCSYITAGKEYEATKAGGQMYRIIVDCGAIGVLVGEPCAQIDGHMWQVVDDETETANQTQGEASRLNTGKPELSYLLTFPKAITEFAKVCMYGGKKYDRGNYLKGGKPLSEYVDCMLRHLTAWQEGEDIDLESECNHLGHVVWNALALCQFCLSGNCIDDRINEDSVR